MNANATRLILYHTAGCHLCDEARQLLTHVPGISLEEVEIGDDPALRERYGLRIPVLVQPDRGVALDWPFTLPAIMEVVSSQPS